MVVTPEQHKNERRRHMGEIFEVSTNGFHTKSITTNINNNMCNKYPLQTDKLVPHCYLPIMVTTIIKTITTTTMTTTIKKAKRENLCNKCPPQTEQLALHCYLRTSQKRKEPLPCCGSDRQWMDKI